MRFPLVALALVLAAISNTAGAQPAALPPPAALTLDEAMRLAEAAHPSVLARQAQLSAAEGTRREAAAWLFNNPELGTEGIRRRANATGSSWNEWSVGIAQPFETGGQQAKRREAAAASLDALRAEIDGKKRSWKDVVELVPEHRSLPSGILQGWPDHAPMTVYGLAGLMISISDNTATDALLTLVGCNARITASLALGGRPFQPTTCRSGEPNGFAGVDLMDDTGARLRLVYLPDGQVKAVGTGTALVGVLQALLGAVAAPLAGLGGAQATLPMALTMVLALPLLMPQVAGEVPPIDALSAAAGWPIVVFTVVVHAFASVTVQV